MACRCIYYILTLHDRSYFHRPCLSEVANNNKFPARIASGTAVKILNRSVFFTLGKARKIPALYLVMALGVCCVNSVSTVLPKVVQLYRFGTFWCGLCNLLGAESDAYHFQSIHCPVGAVVWIFTSLLSCNNKNLITHCDFITFDFWHRDGTKDISNKVVSI